MKSGSVTLSMLVPSRKVAISSRSKQRSGKQAKTRGVSSAKHIVSPSSRKNSRSRSLACTVIRSRHTPFSISASSSKKVSTRLSSCAAATDLA